MTEDRGSGSTVQVLFPRRAWVAVLLSFLMPGLGHVYVGAPEIGLRRYLTVLLVGIGAIVLSILLPLGVFTFLNPAVALVSLYGWIVVDAARRARRTPRDYVPRRYNHWYVYLGLIVLSSLIALVPKQFVEAFRQPSGNMEPTLLLTEWFYAIKGPLRPAPVMHQVVILDSPEEGVGPIVERIVGVPGDTLRMQGGALYRNGSRAVEPFVDTARVAPAWEDSAMVWQQAYIIGVDKRAYAPTSQEWGPLVVPRDSFFVLGDNRDASKDSRFYGFVGRDRLVATPRVIYYSYDPSGDYPLPFLTAIRWDRLGLRVQ